VAIMGELSDIGLPDLIDLLARRGQTGKLTVKADGQEIHLYLANARIMFASTTDLTLRLGRMLIKHGIISSQQLLDALHEQIERQPPRPLGTILLKRALVSEEQLGRCVRDQCVEILSRVVTAQHGMFLYVDGVQVPANLEVVELDVGDVLAEAWQRVERLQYLRNLLPAPSAPLMINERDPGAFNALHRDEQDVIRLMRGGAMSLMELSSQLSLDEMTLGSAILSLRDRGALLALAASESG